MISMEIAFYVSPAASTTIRATFARARKAIILYYLRRPVGVGGACSIWYPCWWHYHCPAIALHKTYNVLNVCRKEGKREKKKLWKKWILVWGNPRRLLISQMDICCSREIQQTRCVIDASGSVKKHLLVRGVPGQTDRKQRWRWCRDPELATGLWVHWSV